MSAYNYNRVLPYIEKHINFNRSEQLALKSGFSVIDDESAYNGRYFIKDGKKWIHNLSALKKRLNIYNNSEIERLGYDIATYLALQ